QAFISAAIALSRLECEIKTRANADVSALARNQDTVSHVWPQRVAAVGHRCYARLREDKSCRSMRPAMAFASRSPLIKVTLAWTIALLWLLQSHPRASADGVWKEQTAE